MYYQVQAHTHHHTTGKYIKRQVAETGMENLFEQLAELEDGGLMFQRTVLAELEFRFLSTNRGGAWWLLQTSWYQLDPGPFFLQQSTQV